MSALVVHVGDFGRTITVPAPTGLADTSTGVSLQLQNRADGRPGIELAAAVDSGQFTATVPDGTFQSGHIGVYSVHWQVVDGSNASTTYPLEGATTYLTVEPDPTDNGAGVVVPIDPTVGARLDALEATPGGGGDVTQAELDAVSALLPWIGTQSELETAFGDPPVLDAARVYHVTDQPSRLAAVTVTGSTSIAAAHMDRTVLSTSALTPTFTILADATLDLPTGTTTKIVAGGGPLILAKNAAVTVHGFLGEIELGEQIELEKLADNVWSSARLNATVAANPSPTAAAFAVSASGNSDSNTLVIPRGTVGSTSLYVIAHQGNRDCPTPAGLTAYLPTGNGSTSNNSNLGSPNCELSIFYEQAGVTAGADHTFTFPSSASATWVRLEKVGTQTVDHADASELFSIDVNSRETATIPGRPQVSAAGQAILGFVALGSFNAGDTPPTPVLQTDTGFTTLHNGLSVGSTRHVRLMVVERTVDAPTSTATDTEVAVAFSPTNTVTNMQALSLLFP